MLKRLVHIISALLLLTATTGFTISKHYCGTEVVSVSINSEAESCCGGMCSSDCCHNETEHFQLKVDFASSNIDFQSQETDIDILFPAVFVFLQTTYIADQNIKIRYPESPPPPKINTLLSLIQTYLC